MIAPYDSFDYPSYWTDREYEHKSEVIALRAFLGRIHKISTILEVGAGFGRLFLHYSYRAKEIILTDPSSKLLRIAKDTFRKRKNIKYLECTLQNLPNKITSPVDLVIMVRVIHHIDAPDPAFKALAKIIKNRGYLILEFANKRHAKAVIKNLIHRNFGFIKNKETFDVRSSANINSGSLPFLNYHPEIIESLLAKYGFEIIEKRSVSNIRIPFAKSVLPKDLLLFAEKLLQKPLAFFDFGPSIFVLARKRG